MSASPPFPAWAAVFAASRSEFFTGSTADTLHDRESGAALAPHGEAVYTQSNGRVLVGQAANGSLRLAALPTRVFPAPTNESEFGLGPGMYHRSEVVMYAGGPHYRIHIDGRPGAIDLSADERDNRSWYADHFLPMTRAEEPGLEMHLLTFAPLAADPAGAALAPAPLPGPAGAIYALHLRNTGAEALSGRVILAADDLLVGHYEDAESEARAWNRPEASLRQQTLILTRPFGAVGIHFHGAKWGRSAAPYTAERTLSLGPGEEALFETHIAMGAGYGDILPVIYELHLHPTLEWLNRTAAFWRARLGRLETNAAGAEPEAALMRDLYIRSLFDNFNCLQTDERGDLLIHWQGAPSHGYGVCWGIDIEPTASSIVHLLPEMTRQVMLFFLKRSRAPIGPADHSVPILVAPVILARLWLDVSGDAAFFCAHPEVLAELAGIMDTVAGLKAPGEDLYPSRFSSDGAVGRRYDFGANCKVHYAFDSLAAIYQALGRGQEAADCRERAAGIRAAIPRRMLAQGPFGVQISGGTNLGEEAGAFYLPEEQLYYDGEDTSSMLAAIYGACEPGWEPWANYHRFARSLWCPTYDPEFGMLNWFPSEPAVQDGTAFFSRLGGCVTPEEMKEAVQILRRNGVDDATGSVFWWPHGLEHKRSLTRCSQGQGAWALQYLEQWLGLRVDAGARCVTIAPRGLVSAYSWQGFRSGANRFDIDWEEGPVGTILRVTQHGTEPWTLRAGFRPWGAGLAGELTWREAELRPGQAVTLSCPALPAAPAASHCDAAVRGRETAAFSPQPELLFRRYGPAMLWGHWEAAKQWQVSELPNALRFLLFNHSGEDWEDVSVALDLPAGWQAFPRLPGHWERPEQYRSGQVALQLGSLKADAHTVAPFWLLPPGGKGLLSPIASGGFGSARVSSHTPSQPGEGLTLVLPGLAAAREAHATATLHARMRSGKRIETVLDVPLRLEPPGSGGG